MTDQPEPVSSSKPTTRVVPRHKLPPREREVADIVYNRGEATAADVRNALLGVSHSSARSMLCRLEAKGVVSRRKDGSRDYFSPPNHEGRVIETRLQQLAYEHFRGSLFDTALKVIEMLEARQPGSTLNLARRYRWPNEMATSGDSADTRAHA